MLKIGNNISRFSTYSCQPKTREELKVIVYKRICWEGSDCDLNDIDVSQIDDMSYLFYRLNFNGDISKWDVSKVKNMHSMFNSSDFDGDISDWNVSNVKIMTGMFFGSSFNGDISNWDVQNVTNMSYMFFKSKFNQDISNWKINERCVIYNVFLDCEIKEEYKPKLL